MIEEGIKEKKEEGQEEKSSELGGGAEAMVGDAQKITEEISGWSDIITAAINTLGWSEILRALTRTICTMVPSVSKAVNQFASKFKLWVKPLTLSPIDIIQMIIWIIITAVWAILILAVVALIAAAVICLSGPENSAKCVYEVVTS